MKKIFTILLLAAVFIAGINCNAVETNNKKLSKQNRLLLPEKIYAVPGVECNIYFRNVFLAINHANYVFDVTCKFGRNDLKRWRFTPGAEDGGKNFPLTLRIYDESNNLVAESSTTVCVAPADAGKGRKISILMVGDSLTNYTVYPARLYELCKGENNPELTMLGTRHHNPRGMEIPPEVKHEGYAGWSWNSFLTRFEGSEKKGKKFTKSKFLFKKDGKIVVSLADYLKERNYNVPDIITIQLGINDIFHAVEEDRDEKIKTILQNADTLIAAFRKDAPNAIIGIGLPTPCANQDAFGSNVKCGQTSWGQYRNYYYLNCAMVKHFKNYDPKLFIIPGNTGLDTENNFPVKKEPVSAGTKEVILRQSNAVHPDIAGYRQIGDVYYAWLKNMLNR